MSEQLPICLLSAVAKSTKQSNPTWSLLLANEYLSPENPLRQALIVRAKENFLKDKLSREERRAFRAACAGLKFNDLPNQIQIALRSNTATSLFVTRRRSIPTPKARGRASRAFYLQEKKLSFR